MFTLGRKHLSGPARPVNQVSVCFVYLPSSGAKDSYIHVPLLTRCHNKNYAHINLPKTHTNRIYHTKYTIAKTYIEMAEGNHRRMLQISTQADVNEGCDK